MTRVLFIQSFIKQYRLPFFDRLYSCLAEDGIEMQVAYGQPTQQELVKGDTAVFERPWGVNVSNHWLVGGRILYQPIRKLASLADLVIVEQANKNLMNLPLLLGRWKTGQKVAFWGHGLNRRTGGGVAEWLKLQTLGWPDWWFAYTQDVTKYLIDQGVDSAIITNTQNSIDTEAFRSDLELTSNEDVAALRRSVGFSDETPVGLYCGALHSEKRIDFLIEAAKQIHAQIPSFRLVVLGGGSEAALVEHAAQEGWICFPGATFGAQKALWFRLAHFVLNPALVGLAILDAFCAGLPLVASSLPGHGPEIDYLEDNGNGLMAPNSPETYAATVVDLINDPEMRKRLSTGAMASADRYSMEQMVANFREGIHRCLNA